jgi:short-subunit dehydrogenase
MKIEGSTVLITGAAGGIGSATARRLGRSGARLLLTDLRPGPLRALVAELGRDGINAADIACNIGSAEGREALARAAEARGVDVVVNVAGINPFGLVVEQSAEEIEMAIAINTIAPLQLCRALLPQLARRAEAHVVNVGSVFGSIGYPGFAVYSASKFAVRGFTEAMRREHADSPVRFHYVAPRATRTALATDRIRAMNEALKVATDTPESVATAIEKTLRRSRRETHLGVPERLFALLNAVLPGLIDRALKRQLPVIRRFAARSAESADRASPSIQLNAIGAER